MPHRRPSNPLRFGDKATPEDLNSFEGRYRIQVPTAWRRWCEERGWLRQEDHGWELLGVTPTPSGLDAPALLAGVRFVHPDFPPDLLPVERLPEGQLACLVLDGTDDPAVVLLDLADPASWWDRRLASPRFTDYRTDFIEQARAVRRIANFLDRTEREVREGRRAADQAPRPDDWRAYRFCSQNVVVALALLRYNRDDGVLDVGACAIAALGALDPDAPARALCTLLLADAYRAGGNLAIRFVAGTRRDADLVKIPLPLVRWAKRVGIPLDRNHGLIPAPEALQLFIESIQVSDGLRELLRSEDLRTDAPAICFGVASALWHPAEVEAILRWSANPGRVLRGGAQPLDRLAYAQDLLDTRAGLLVASLVRRAALPPGTAPLDAEDAAQPVALAVHGDGTCVLRARAIDLRDWSLDSAPPPPTSALQVVVADAEPDQLPAAVRAKLSLPAAAGPELRAVLCPRDLRSLPATEQANLLAAARTAGVVLLAAPDYTPGLTVRAADKLDRARTTRQ